MKGAVALEPRFFATPEEFRDWLEANHASESELWVGFHKKGSGKPSITWPESVEQALCFGWIDGVRRSLGGTSYAIRFTPRKPSSNWSRVNVETAERLERSGLMRPSGLKAFEARSEARTAIYAYEQAREAELSDDHARELRANRDAWEYFQSKPPWYRRSAIRWIVSAKKEETRKRRLTTLIECSGRGEDVPPLRRRP